MATKLLLILFFSLSFMQEPCEGHCLSEDELQRVMNDVMELKFEVGKYKEIEENLNSQIYMYIQNDSLNVSLINDYKNQLVWKEEMIDLVKPKWYDNKYLWFFGGIILTSGAVYLAGQID